MELGPLYVVELIGFVIGFAVGRIKKSNAVFEAQCYTSAAYIDALIELGHGEIAGRINMRALDLLAENEMKRKAGRAT